MRTDPPVSDPIAAGASPAATATPDPLDEPPGNPMHGEIPRIPRRAQLRVDAPSAERELDHLRLAEDHHAGGKQPRDRGGGLGAAPVAPQRRSDPRQAAVHLQQVLQRDRQPVERPERHAARAPRVGRARQVARQLGLDRHERIEPAVGALDAREIALREFERTRLAPCEQGGQFGQRQERIDGSGHAAKSGSSG
jgi:hypothetical protein